MEYHQDRGFRLLKFIVKAMGAVLVVGIFFLFFVVVKRIEDPNYLRLVPKCSLASLERIAINGKALSSFKEDGTLLFLVENKGHKSLVSIDLCTGKEQRRIVVDEQL
jgi:hypothetical protein